MKLAAELRRRKCEFAAWETLEASKNWLEAEADVCEAIDFCEYYARQALELARPLPVHPYPGEINESWLQPLGAGVVIPPWNFPLAILVGMTIGPVAAGNTVVLKPSSYTPVIAASFHGGWWPPPASRTASSTFCPAAAARWAITWWTISGPALSTSPAPRKWGCASRARAAQVQPGQHWLKRAFMEMGGKDAMVVDETADLDAAIAAVMPSAFGFQGQKCSAASRLIVSWMRFTTPLLERLVAAAAKLQVGPAEENFPVAAVISEDPASEPILAEIDQGQEPRPDSCWAARPWTGTAATISSPRSLPRCHRNSRLAQYEIFGPVLAVIRARDFDEAVQIFNGTDYGLTGGLFSRSRERLERAKREFDVGNLYINRKITGALVGVQPFGGFKMSGSNAKAGGPDYLRLFLEMKTVAEKL